MVSKPFQTRYALKRHFIGLCQAKMGWLLLVPGRWRVPDQSRHFTIFNQQELANSRSYATFWRALFKFLAWNVQRVLLSQNWWLPTDSKQAECQLFWRSHGAQLRFSRLETGSNRLTNLQVWLKKFYLDVSIQIADLRNFKPTQALMMTL